MGIGPNGTIPLRGERSSSGSTRPFELPSGVFIMRKAVAAIRRRNTLSAVPLAIQKPAGQANNQTYRRLQRFFVLTKGMSVVGPRPALPNEVATYNDYQRQRLLVKPGMTCYWQTRRNRDSITFEKGKRGLYAKCKEIADRERAGASYLQPSVRYLQKEFSSEFMNDRISLLMEMRESDPTEAIGKSKELIESCCKTILGKMQISADKNWDLNKLVKETMKALSITTETVTGNSREASIVRQILGSLSGLATGVAEFRNEYGCGHGREAGFLALPVRHAKLAVGSSITLVEYLWETFNWRSGGNQN